MPDKKLEPKQSGFLGMFKRRDSGLNSTHVPSNGKKEQSTTPSPRRAYKPRYAERDMILSMPVEQRPDLVAKANEVRLQGVCSDIGFSTAASLHSGSRNSRIGSRSWSSRHMPTHPNLHLKLYGGASAHAAGSSVSSLHNNVLHGSGMNRMASSPASMRDKNTHASHAELSSRALEQYRPSPRSYHSVPAMSQLDTTSIEAVNQAYAELGISGADFELERALRMSGMDYDLSDVAHVGQRSMATHGTMHQRPPYFGHNDTLPNLKGGKGKGKQATRSLTGVPPSIAGSSDYGDASEKDDLDDPESYILRTSASQTSALIAAHEHPTHDLESSSSSFAESYGNRVANDFWSRNSSERTTSTSTLMTSHSETSVVRPATAESHTPDVLGPG
ncbi:hypothetical protein CLAFUW4_00984 [Fulvia fulva]|uniref:Uncharacterized protein n=1 Tax=Passalora fulva TaxID=5499 RepID=A0A9Q8P3I9_PASFU|nr:uncharacterized protein CLAFUR5_00990 [Fulvia fulva]KAK4635014.1 hypothetical protein CLAFUR4_00985 [Fulvia fulva]KAK4636505.1 hypothetical protein CLAFUR0_00986 [Fulvia fulva]UJO11983.1 hypothetical protein CLAFUR5_00990 [Fulvia fulva]WPV09244.1 hypothetical protein CLAFUW4_00984 [Fulvia fulva]WPV24029.1 hypothetical protein CLAFUW7_00832 [Fulvia fulva]